MKSLPFVSFLFFEVAAKHVTPAFSSLSYLLAVNIFQVVHLFEGIELLIRLVLVGLSQVI